MLHKDEIVVDAATMHEGALVGVDEVGHLGRQPKGKNFRQQLGKTMHQTDGAKVSNFHRSILLREQRDESPIHLPKVLSTPNENSLQGCEHIIFHDGPARLVEIPRKSVWAGGTIRRYVLDGNPSFFNGKSCLKIREIEGGQPSRRQ
jgi:hypothetical protein